MHTYIHTYIHTGPYNISVNSSLQALAFPASSSVQVLLENKKGNITVIAFMYVCTCMYVMYVCMYVCM